MAEGTAAVPRLTIWGLNWQRALQREPEFLRDHSHPVLIVLGSSGDPILLFSKALGHGGDLFARNGGNFTNIDLTWLNSGRRKREMHSTERPRRRHC